MLHLHQLAAALRDTCEEFRSYEEIRRADAERYRARLRALAQRTADEAARAVGAERAPGALPSTELDARQCVGVGFEASWQSHEEARRWALDVLHERVTFAADGSQILPGREISLPLAAVQIASFENPHRHTGEYTKTATLKIIPPGDLLKNENLSTSAYVAFRRFALEVEAIKDFMRRQQGWRERGERMPLAFLDGTLQLQLTARAADGTATHAPDDADYITALKELVELSQATRVPVVGYIDQSYARDIVVLLNTIAGESRHKPSMLFDAQLFDADAESELMLPAGWGARTIFFYCLRRGLVEHFVDANMRPLVGFTYLRAVTDAAPARLDIPAWVYDVGVLDEVADVVRAECVVGNGYPYPVETADAAAALSPDDRGKFLRLVGEFSREQQLGFRLARKRISKNARR